MLCFAVSFSWNGVDMFGCKTSCCNSLACCLGYCLLLTSYREGNDTFKSSCKLPCPILLVSGWLVDCFMSRHPRLLFIVLLVVNTAKLIALYFLLAMIVCGSLKTLAGLVVEPVAIFPYLNKLGNTIF